MPGSQPAEFDLYEDDGVSLDYRTGAHALTALRFVPDGGAGNYTLTISPAKGKFKGQLAGRRYCVQVHGLFKPQGVSLNGRNLAEDRILQRPEWLVMERTRAHNHGSFGKTHFLRQGNCSPILECGDVRGFGHMAEGLESSRPGAPSQARYETQARRPARRTRH